MNVARTFDFGRQLQISETDQVRSLVERAMRSRFVDLLQIHKAHKENDKRGIDYFLEFRHGRVETLDVKVRTTDFAARGDPCNVALETIANTSTNKPGWTVDPDKLTDWVLFVWLDTERHDLVHFRQLQAATVANQKIWQAKKKVATQITRTNTDQYAAQSVFVSPHDMWAGIYRQFSYENGAPQTPKSREDDAGKGDGAE